MKLLFPYLARWRSANRSRYHQLLTHLCQLGHEVHVLKAPPMALDDISARDVESRRSDVPGLEVTEFKASPALRAFWEMSIPRSKGFKKSLLALSSIDEIRRTIARQKIDVVLLYNLSQSVLLDRVDCHKHFDLADDLVEMMQLEHPLLSSIGGRAAARASQQRLIDRSQSVTVASGVLASRVARPTLLLPNGADVTELDGADGSEWRSLGLGKTVGFVGAFEYWVDFELILSVATKLTHLTFLLVGGGRRWTTVKGEVSRRGLSNVHLTGPVAYETAMNYVAGMDVCLLPFTHDAVSDASCPLKLFEYAAQRRPIVSTRTTEVQRIGEGWISFADDALETAQAIEELLRNKELARSASDAGRALVEERYNWHLLSSRFAEYLLSSL